MPTKNQKKLATIFDGFSIDHLYKDVGMIPVLVGSFDGYGKSLLVSWEKFSCATDLIVPDYVNSHVDFFKIKAQNRLSYLAKLVLLLKTQKVTEVNLYHITAITLFSLLVFRIFGFPVIIKADISVAGIRELIQRKKSCWICHLFYVFVCKRAKYILCETIASANALKECFGLNNIRLCFNGVDVRSLLDQPRLSYANRNNEVVVVGRIGSPEKNHKLILDALENIDSLNGWTIKFVGPILDASLVESLRQCRHGESVKFMGKLDRSNVIKECGSAKVFLMTSLWEGFSLALTEAAFMGCYIISTNVGGAIEVTDNFKLGDCITYDDPIQLSSLLSSIFLANKSIGDTFNNRIEYASNALNLETNIRKYF